MHIGRAWYDRRCIRQMFRQNHDLRKLHLPPEVVRDAKNFWRGHLALPVNLRWHQAYASVNGIADVRYVPEDHFFTWIEKGLNAYPLAWGYNDKNNYHRIFPAAPMPKVLLRNIHGRYFDEAYQPASDLGGMLAQLDGGEYIIKPSYHSGQGKNVRLIKFTGETIHVDGKDITATTLTRMYGEDFLIQERLGQHAALQTVHPPSLNTIRIMTLRYGGEIRPLSSVIKFGGHGSIADNLFAGGFCCGIREDGSVKSFAIDKIARKYTEHPVTHVRFEGLTVPGYHLALDLVRRLHEALINFDTASWDVAIGVDGRPVLIEVNLITQGVNIHQFNNGPIFGGLTEEVLALAQRRNTLQLA